MVQKIPNNHLTCMKPLEIMGYLPYQVMQDFWTINNTSDSIKDACGVVMKKNHTQSKTKESSEINFMLEVKVVTLKLLHYFVASTIRSALRFICFDFFKQYFQQSPNTQLSSIRGVILFLKLIQHVWQLWCMFELLSNFTSSCCRSSLVVVDSRNHPLSLFLPNTTSCCWLFSRQNLHIFLFWKLRGSALAICCFPLQKCQNKWYIPPKFNIASEKWWLEDYFPIGKATFQERTVKLREGILPKFNSEFASEKWTAFEPKNHLIELIEMWRIIWTKPLCRWVF